MLNEEVLSVEVEIDLNQTIPSHDVEIDFDDIAVLAERFSQPTTETRQMIAALRPTNDKGERQKRAETILASLQQQSELLREKLDAGTQDFKAIMIAIAENDRHELARLGISTDYAWLDDVVTAMISGGPFVGIETIGPYAAHHVDNFGNLSVSETTLSPDETTGLLLGRLVRNMTNTFKHVRFVALLDDFTQPIATQPFTEDQQNLYMLAMSKLFKRNGVLFPDDVAGKDYLLIRESEQAGKIDELIARLQATDAGLVETTHEGDTIFYPTKSFIDKLSLISNNRRSEFRKRGIAIRRQHRPTCHALDAATYLHPRNKEVMHVAILDQRFASQQDKTYTLLRALDIVRQDRYHNVFFDAARLSPELIAYAMCHLLQQSVHNFLRRQERLNQWEEFNPIEYATRNYGDHILSEDRSIMKFVIETLAKSDIRCNTLDLVADVGAGPNLYPAMLLAPYLQESGSIDMIEYTDVNRSYMRGTLLEDETEKQTSIWNKFEQYAVGVGGEHYVGTLDRTRRKVNVVAGSIFELPSDRYDLITSYFVCESITESLREFWMSIRALATSVKPGGTLIVAHMIGSQGWHAGEGTHFPAVDISLEDIEEAYRDADLSFEIFTADDETDKAREGYRGMAVVVAKRMN